MNAGKTMALALMLALGTDNPKPAPRISHRDKRSLAERGGRLLLELMQLGDFPITQKQTLLYDLTKAFYHLPNQIELLQDIETLMEGARRNLDWQVRLQWVARVKYQSLGAVFEKHGLFTGAPHEP